MSGAEKIEFEEKSSVETLRITFDLISKLTSRSFIIVIIILVSVLQVVSVHVIEILICIRFS